MFSQKTILPTKSVFWVQLFCVHFLLRSYVHFKNQFKKTDFLTPHSTQSKKKSFHLLAGSACTFYELKSPKWKQPLNISENGFL